MIPAATALVLYLAYLLVAFGLRSWLMNQRTGSTGYRGLSGTVGSARWWGGVLFATALLAGLAAPALQLADFVPAITMLNTALLNTIGVVLVLIGTAATLAAQHAMGTTWRVGVDAEERTELVQTGLFALVRNPFFTALLTTATGLFLLAPNPIALAALAVLFVAVQLQVRVVEEPYLLAVQEDAYRNYAHATGRFLPGIGKRPTH
ncbi:methyltransferase family protein [Aeromicrobium piscarium]|uniref:Isoprenylcysteine carboxylmethyltransferase family protein n=1 Tax=Aeromicrobium piscarium TaxID=2590901 RepID=A0A554S7V1_9ACTN|nr:isoprenylcysteine carboxylmethyltransferase family protein [Aeromicrobium piscarium]TSD62428.1 isoprenylcysteine carboxylmethyltransferase family protein [Aeromicrobium piscarium]